MVRHEAAEAMGAISKEESLPILKEFLHDPYREVRETCEIALAKVQWDNTEDGRRAREERERERETSRVSVIVLYMVRVVWVWGYQTRTISAKKTETRAIACTPQCSCISPSVCAMALALISHEEAVCIGGTRGCWNHAQCIRRCCCTRICLPIPDRDELRL